MQKYIIAGLILLGGIILISGGIFLYVKSTVKKPVGIVQEQNQVIPSLTPSDIGLSLSLIQSGKFANNGIEMMIIKLNEIASIDYELDYTSQGNIPRGAIGHIDVKPTDTKIDQLLPFGTCSDVCHFDQGVSNIKLTLKITKQDGSIYQLIQPFSLPQ